MVNFLGKIIELILKFKHETSIEKRTKILNEIPFIEYSVKEDSFKIISKNFDYLSLINKYIKDISQCLVLEYRSGSPKLIKNKNNHLEIINMEAKYE